MSLRSALKPGNDTENKQEITKRGRRTVILGALAVTVLN